MNTVDNVLDIKKILKILPHRYPLLLIDRVLNFQKFQYLIALKNCTVNECFFQGHFLEQPILPGILIIESMVQASGILIYQSTGQLNINELYYFVGIENARFKKNVIPGDQIFITVKIIKIRKKFLIFHNIAMVNKKIVCNAKIIFLKKTFTEKISKKLEKNE